MKTNSFILAMVTTVGLVLGANVSAQVMAPTPPTPFEGIFAYEGQYQITGYRHSEILVLLNDTERARMETLKQEGYSCILKPANQALCSINRTLDPFDPAVQQKVTAAYAGYRVQFYEAFGSPSLEINSQMFQQWRVEQKVVIETPSRDITSRAFAFANYTWANGIDKIYPGGNDNPDHDLFVPSMGGLEIPVVFHSQPHRFVLDTYYVTIRLARQ